MKGSDNKEDFKLNVLQVLGWVHDLDKSLETRKNQIYDRLNDKYLEEAPELVIEIDTKADLSEVQNPLGYYQVKTQELLDFGVKKVIWIFTDTRKVMVAETDNKWEISNWDNSIEVWDGKELNLGEVLGE